MFEIQLFPVHCCRILALLSKYLRIMCTRLVFNILRENLLLCSLDSLLRNYTKWFSAESGSSLSLNKVFCSFERIVNVSYRGRLINFCWPKVGPSRNLFCTGEVREQLFLPGKIFFEIVLSLLLMTSNVDVKHRDMDAFHLYILRVRETLTVLWAVCLCC